MEHIKCSLNLYDTIYWCFTLNAFLQVGLWVFGGALKVDAVTAAILGLSVLLVTGVVTWKECLGEAVAWDTLTWFAALIAMAGYLNKYGLISWFSETVVKVRFHFLFSLDDCYSLYLNSIQLICAWKEVDTYGYQTASCAYWSFLRSFASLEWNIRFWA